MTIKLSEQKFRELLETIYNLPIDQYVIVMDSVMSYDRHKILFPDNLLDVLKIAELRKLFDKLSPEQIEKITKEWKLD